jgi:hypothetical protein
MPCLMLGAGINACSYSGGVFAGGKLLVLAVGRFGHLAKEDYSCFGFDTAFQSF